MIGVRTAFLLYALLLAFAFVALKGKFLSLAVVIVLALAAKTYLEHVRRQ